MKLNLLTLGLALTLSSMLSAQQLYNVQTTQENYTELSGATVLNLGVWDVIEHGLELPFPFEIGGITLDSIFLTNQGLQGTLSPSVGIGFPSIGAIDAEIVDRAEHSGLSTTLSPISYKNYSMNGMQYLTVQYKNIGFSQEDVSSGASVDYMNYQVTLGSDHSVAFHYGESNISTPEDYFVNSMGVLMGIVPKVILSNTGGIIFNLSAHILSEDPSSPTLVLETDPAIIANGNTGFNSDIISGTKYTFKVISTVGLNDISNQTVSILNPIVDQISFTSNGIISNLKMVNCLGQTIINMDVTNQNTIDASSLTSGVYFMQFTHEGQTISTQKVIKL